MTMPQYLAARGPVSFADVLRACAESPEELRTCIACDGPALFVGLAVSTVGTGNAHAVVAGWCDAPECQADRERTTNVVTMPVTVLGLDRRPPPIVAGQTWRHRRSGVTRVVLRVADGPGGWDVRHRPADHLSHPGNQCYAATFLERYERI